MRASWQLLPKIRTVRQRGHRDMSMGMWYMGICTDILGCKGAYGDKRARERNGYWVYTGDIGIEVYGPRNHGKGSDIHYTKQN